MPGGGVPPGVREGANGQIAQLKDKNKGETKKDSEWRSRRTYLFVGVLIIIIVILTLVLL